MHLQDEEVQRLLHGELTGTALADASRHLEECGVCSASLDRARREETRLLGLLSTLDESAPAVDWEALAARARWPRLRAGRWAAGVLLALGVAGAAYAAPGSPLPGLVRRMAAWVTRPSTPPAATDSARAEDEVPAGIALPPGERFVISFRTAQPQGRVTVVLSEGPNIVLRSRNGRVTFATDIDRVTVENVGATADYEIDLPRAAPSIELWIGARRVMLKRGDTVSTVWAPEGPGRYAGAMSE